MITFKRRKHQVHNGLKSYDLTDGEVTIQPPPPIHFYPPVVWR